VEILPSRYAVEVIPPVSTLGTVTAQAIATCVGQTSVSLNTRIFIYSGFGGTVLAMNSCNSASSCTVSLPFTGGPDVYHAVAYADFNLPPFSAFVTQPPVLCPWVSASTVTCYSGAFAVE
jgi:hypothetical protein